MFVEARNWAIEIFLTKQNGFKAWRVFDVTFGQLRAQTNVGSLTSL